MKIGEAAKKAGISASNIRFYEKKGLLEPKRDESSYRNYTEADVERLKRILVFRKMDLPVEKIALILEGEEDVKTALRHQEEKLESQMKELEGSLMLCRKLEGEENPLEVDPEEYLCFIQEEEQEGRKFSQAEELLWELSEFAADQYGGSGWFTAVFGSWAGVVKLVLGAGLWLFFLYRAGAVFFIEPFSFSQAFFWGGLFLVYNMSFLKYWAEKKKN